jgi:hypothetical protein
MFTNTLDGRDVGSQITPLGFFHGQRFAGEGALDDEEVLGRNHPAVTGNHIARRKRFMQ